MKRILLIAVIAFLISCTYNKSELPLPEETQVEITYTNFVKSMIDSNNCLLCHFNGYLGGPGAGGRDFQTYEGIRDAANAGVLQARAIDGVSPTMPLGFPELSDPIKDTLQMWIDQGALE